MPPVIMFDLDQTPAESKQPLTREMAVLIATLLTHTKVAVISGGALSQFLTQVVGQLPPLAQLKYLYLLPTSGAALYEWSAGTWVNVYEERLSTKEAAHVKEVIRKVLKKTRVIDLATPSYGERIEYRGSQVSLSALGQRAPLELKKVWDPDKSKRRTLQKTLAELLPDYAVGMGGATTIDITKKGVDKAYGIERLAAHLKTPIDQMLYVGDELTPGGNDAPALRTPIQTYAVKNPGDTAFFIASLLPR